MLTYHYYNENLKTLELERDFTTSITQKSWNLKRDNVESECAPKYITLNLIFHIFNNNSKLGHLRMQKRD